MTRKLKNWPWNVEISVKTVRISHQSLRILREVRSVGYAGARLWHLLEAEIMVVRVKNGRNNLVDRKRLLHLCIGFCMTLFLEAPGDRGLFLSNKISTFMPLCCNCCSSIGVWFNWIMPPIV